MESLKEIRKYKPHYYYGAEDVAETLINLAGVTEEARTDLENAIYYIAACAQNHYNSDSFRVLYNTLQTIVDNSCIPF